MKNDDIIPLAVDGIIPMPEDQIVPDEPFVYETPKAQTTSELIEMYKSMKADGRAADFGKAVKDLKLQKSKVKSDKDPK